MKFKTFLSIVISVFLVACQKTGKMKGSKEIIIIPKKDINQKLSLKIYIVQIYSDEALDQISNMQADQFFEKAKSLTLSFPDEIKIWEYDIIEDSHPTCFILPNKKKYWGLVVFFNFIENTENKFVFPEFLKSVEITLENGTFQVTNTDKGFRYIKNKVKLSYCIFLNHDDCIHCSYKMKSKVKKFSHN